ncbi:MAG: VOC family protein [Hyphomicrobiaceae bacterium]
MCAATAKPDLAYIALASRDMDRAVRFLGEDLALTGFRVGLPGGGEAPAFRVGETALVVLPEGDDFLATAKPGVDHIALAAADPLAVRDASGIKGLAIDDVGLNGSRQAAVDRTETCGVNVRFTPALERPAATNGLVQRIDHIGIASGDNDAAESIFCGTFGAVYESRQTDMEVATAMESFTSDKYGAIYQTRAPQIVGGLRVSFLTVGDLELEFLQNFDPAQGFEIKQGSAGTTKQDQSAIGRFVASRGGGLHHIAFKVDDVDAMLARLAGRDHQLIDVVGRPGSRRARIGFVHPSSTGGILFHFVERTELD